MEDRRNLLFFETFAFFSNEKNSHSEITTLDFPYQGGAFF